MPKRERSKIFLVSVMRGDAVVHTYAVVLPTAALALEVVSALCPEGCEPSLVGGLSSRIGRALKLTPGDGRQV